MKQFVQVILIILSLAVVTAQKGQPPPPSVVSGCTSTDQKFGLGSDVQVGDIRTCIRGLFVPYTYYLSGAAHYVNIVDSPNFGLLGPQGGDSAVGNLEHIVVDHYDVRNSYTPRDTNTSVSNNGPITWLRTSNSTVRLTRLPQDEPWGISWTIDYTVTAPNYLDIIFRPTFPANISTFGPWVSFFLNQYLNYAPNGLIHFLGIPNGSTQEQWIADDPSNGSAGAGSGGYRPFSTTPLTYTIDQNNQLAVITFDTYQFTQPFYFIQLQQGMVFALLLDRNVTTPDLNGSYTETLLQYMRHFNKPPTYLPAADWSFVVFNPQPNATYEHRARIVWKKCPANCEINILRADIQSEYASWSTSLPR